MNKYIIAVAAITTMLVSGCTIPKYTVPAGIDVAKVTFSTNSYKRICVAGKRHWLDVDSTGYATIPAGSRETIIIDYSNYVYQGTSTSCSARSSFVPQAGQKYYVDFQIEGNRCYAIPFKESNANRTGLEIEPSLAPSMECAAEKW